MVTMAQALSIVIAGVSIAAMATQSTLRAKLIATLAKWTAFNAPGGLWRIAAILLALANLKNLPFVWHVCLSPCPAAAIITKTDQKPIDSTFPRLDISHLLSANADSSPCAVPARYHVYPNEPF
jgi:hypothetical protein